MRPFLVLTAVFLLAVSVLGQQPLPHPIYGPFVPLVTTPEISFQTFSPNPVGATNATTGLIAGATNSTLSQIQGSTSSETTVPVWYQGGDAPLVSSQIHLYPERINREGRVMREDRGPEDQPRKAHAQEQARASWTYYSGSDQAVDAASASAMAKGSRKANHVYTNDDVTRQNDKNGAVRHDGKTEKM